MQSAEEPDRLGLQVKPQQPMVFKMPQEVATLDHLRRQVDQRHGVELALARYRLTRGRHIEHRQQVAVRVEHRARRAGQPGMPATEVFIAMNRQGLTLHQAGADAIGAFAGFAPIGTEPQPGALEDLALLWQG